MDATFQYPDNNNVKQTEASRKRLNVSGRLSPRALFGNLKKKKEETAKLKDMPFHKTVLGWKPPLRVESNDSDCAGPIYHDHSSLMFVNSSQNCDNNPSPKEQSLNINRQNDFDCNKSFSLKESGIMEDQGKFTGNLDETVNYEEYPKTRAMSQGECLGYLKESKSHDLSLDESINDEISENISKHQIHDVDENKIDMSQSLDDNIVLLMNYNSQFLNNSLKEPICKSIHDSVNSQPEDNCGVLYQENNRDHKYTQAVENEEYLEESVNSLSEYSPKITADLMDNSKTSSMESKEELFGENFKNQSKVLCGTPQEQNVVEDSFDLSITNSQFLLSESHAEKKSYNSELIESTRIQLDNSIKSIKRSSSSLAVQSDWQKNLLRNMIKDIDELSKTVVNATVLMKSAQRGPTKQ